jgi:uncharacterized membrane protein YraQ (UPF0718 family)
MAAARTLLGLTVGVAVGCAVAGHAEGLLRSADGTADADHAHPSHTNRIEAFTGHLVGDFIFMGRFLVLGAALAALLQTVVPQTVLAGVAGSAVLAPPALMTLAFLLSLCSQADAFVATSFTGFSPGSQLAFLVLGPMADTKLAVLYGATFRRRFVAQLLAVAVPLALLGALAFDGLT